MCIQTTRNIALDGTSEDCLFGNVITLFLHANLHLGWLNHPSGIYPSRYQRERQTSCYGMVPRYEYSLQFLSISIDFHVSGGGYQQGSTHDAPPDLLMHSSTKPFIFISFEYRLGPFGFLGAPVFLQGFEWDIRTDIRTRWGRRKGERRIKRWPA
jgi:hypothetical protein